MSNTAVSTEPRGIAAAMSQPVFTPKMGQSALGAADRATRRWAPESPEDQPRAMRSLSFVDRMVAPWVTASQRSAGLRMFSQYNSSEMPERAITGVSWVFPRPWYQDELDWIAASRANQAGHDMIFTTRGTYAQAADRRRETMSPQMLEYVAPSFAPSSSEAASAYSPLVSHSSYSAASVVAQSMQAIQTASAMARGMPVRSVEAAGAMAPASAMTAAMGASFGSLAPLVSSLIPDGESSRFAMASGPSALALRAPQLVTPPSPRAESEGAAEAAAQHQQLPGEHSVQAARSEREAQVARAAAEVTARQEQSRAMAVAFAQERERVAEQMRVQARVERERASTASVEAAPAAPSAPSHTEIAAREAFRAEAIRIEAARVERSNVSRVQSSARQQARIDAIVAERMARLEIATAASASESASSSEAVPSAAASSSPSSSSAVAATPPSEAQSQAMVQALRMAELLAHAAAVGPSAMAPAAGPRMSLPSGLGGLVAGMNTVAVIHRERALANEPMVRRENAPLPFSTAFHPVFAAPFAVSSASVEAPVAANDDQRGAAPGASAAPAMARAAAPMVPPVAAWAPRSFAPEALRTDSALGAIASSAPAALGHVAWADRWLGRFAGASEAALDAMSTISMRARLAPSQAFLAPMIEGPRVEASSFESPSRFSAPALDVVAPRRAEAPSSLALPAAASPVAAQARAEEARVVDAPRSQPAALRFADDDVVSDDVFAAIAAAAPARREAQRAAAAAASAPGGKAAATPAAAPLPPQQFARVPQLTAADMVALTAPSAPVDAGLSASLAASPMAPALGHVLALPRTAVFDTRSLGGAELAAAFLAGSVNAPMVAQYAHGGSAAGRVGSFGGVTSSLWSDAAAADDVAAPSLWRQWSAELVRPAELTRAPARDDVRFDGRAESGFDSVVSSSARPSAVPATAAPAAIASPSPAAAAAANENIITLRSTLLAPASPRQQRLAASAGTAASWANQEAIDLLPVAYQTLGELLQEAAPDQRWLSSVSSMSSVASLPGGSSEATLASQGWDAMSAPPRFDQGFPLVFWPLANAPATASFAERFAEVTSAPYAQASSSVSSTAGRGARAAAPLLASAAADFDASIAVPALVEQGLPGSMDRGALSPGMLAQRALGFGAVQSSQAADLSFDFVPPELVLAARVYGFGPAEAAQAARLAMGGSTGLSAMAGAVDLRFVSLMGPAQGRFDGREGREEARAFGGTPSPSSEIARPQEAAREQDAAFGVARRTPRGAFLLPSASVAAMGLSAALPEGEHSMSIAALEVLAAKMVAELGSFASPALLAASAAESSGASAPAVGAPARRAPSATMVDLSQPARSDEASEAEVLSSAATSISSSRRARFESLYVALAESSAGRTMSPAARAARALALANRDEDATTLSSRERAALAWQIFPVVLNGEGAPIEAGSSAEVREQRGSSAQRARSAPELPTVAAASPAERPGAEMRPGLAPLSSRAGEALSSFVTASPTSNNAPASSESRSNTAWRSGRYGGGEVEIPGWFEAAARKMFEDRGEIEGISLAELTLVASTPPSQIAASDRSAAPSAAPKQASPDGKGEKGQKVDIESVAADVYRAVMQMMESARMRNGEPFL